MRCPSAASQSVSQSWRPVNHFFILIIAFSPLKYSQASSSHSHRFRPSVVRRPESLVPFLSSLPFLLPLSRSLSLPGSRVREPPPVVRPPLNSLQDSHRSCTLTMPPPTSTRQRPTRDSTVNPPSIDLRLLLRSYTPPPLIHSPAAVFYSNIS